MMNISQKLSLAFLSTALLLGAVGFTSLKSNDRVKANVNEAILKGSQMTNLLTTIQADFRILESETYQYLLEKESKISPGQLDRERQKILGILSVLEQKLLELDKTSEKRLRFDVNSPIELEEKKEEEGEGKKINDELNLIRIADKLQEKNIKLEEIIRNILEKNNLDETHNDRLTEQLETLLNGDIYPLLEKYEFNLAKDQKEKTEIIRTYLDNNNRIIAGSTSAALIFSLLLGIYTVYTISRPIEQLKSAALLVGKGEFNVHVPEIRNNEIGILAKSFNLMVSGLKDTTVSKSYLDKILSSMADSLIVLDSYGKIIKANRATYQLLGYQESELIEQNFQLILSDTFLRIENLIEIRLLNNFDLTYITKQGKKIPISFSSSIIQNETGKIEGIVCLGRDITQKQETEKALRESEERYALASRAANDGLWDWNLLSKKIYFSLRWKSLLGYEDKSIDNSPDEWFKRVHPDHLEQVSQAIISYLQNPLSPLEITYQILHKDGSYRWMLCRAIAVKNSEGQISRLIGSQTDITSSRLAEEKLRYQALYDGLTGLPNRSFFLDKLRKLFDRAKKSPEQMFAILFLDLDDFKKINDSLGHLVGDELLINFSDRLKNCLRSEDTFARLGGDEFAILMTNIKDISDATNLAVRIFKLLEKPLRVEGRELFITTSIGIAPATNNYLQVEDLLRDADTAMYQAKNSGKGRYTIFEPEMYLQAINALDLENDLRQAIEREEFEVFYQPIVKLIDRQIVGFEALVRWNHPSKGRISPAQFIPVAEETGSICPIGYWVMEQACRQMRIWLDKYQVAQTMTVSVNLSPVQLKQSESNNPFNCLKTIQNILKKTALPAHHLKLEITESTIMESLDRANSIMEEMQAIGIKLSMDDFGTGYSSLNYLHHLSLDTLKIDRSFIKEIETNTDKLQLTRTIINLAQTLKMNVVAEGVETIEQQTLLAELNCEYGQGYLFSKPVSSTDAEILIATTQQLAQFVSGNIILNASSNNNRLSTFS